MKLTLLSVALGFSATISFAQESRSVSFTVTGVQGDSTLSRHISKGKGAKFDIKGDTGVLNLPMKNGNTEAIELKLSKSPMPQDDWCRNTYLILGRDDAMMYMGHYIQHSSDEKCRDKQKDKDLLTLGSWDMDDKGRSKSMGHLMLE